MKIGQDIAMYFKRTANKFKYVSCWPLNFLVAIFILIIAPWYRNTRSLKTSPWVIGGHRGRIYEDNAAALHSYIIKNTSQSVIWIAGSRELYRKLKNMGAKVLMRDSIRARLAIVRAPVLIYSHGEDDIDRYLKYCRKHIGLRVYLNLYRPRYPGHKIRIRQPS